MIIQSSHYFSKLCKFPTHKMKIEGYLVLMASLQIKQHACSKFKHDYSELFTVAPVSHCKYCDDSKLIVQTSFSHTTSALRRLCLQRQVISEIETVRRKPEGGRRKPPCSLHASSPTPRCFLLAVWLAFKIAFLHQKGRSFCFLFNLNRFS